MTTLEYGRAQVDVVDVQRLAVDLDVSALQAPRFTRFPGEVVLRVMDDGQTAEDRVAELVSAQPPRRGHHPSIPVRRQFPHMARTARTGPHDLLERDDIRVDVPQHGGRPFGGVRQSMPRQRWML